METAARLDDVAEHEEAGAQLPGQVAGALEVYGFLRRATLQAEQRVGVHAAQLAGAAQLRGQQVDDSFAQVGELAAAVHEEGDDGDQVGRERARRRLNPVSNRGRRPVRSALVHPGEEQR